MERHDFIWHVR